MKRRTLLTIVFLLLAPATLIGGFFLLDERKYFFISLLLIIYMIIPFFALFESRKPMARELVIIAVMVAIGVVGRAAFFMIPQFKPVLAIVIISGIALGRESGFLIGALIVLASNFIYGQGPHTPWQMFAMGIAGFLAGYLAEKKILEGKLLPLLVFGAFCGFILYGAIVDIWTILGSTPNPTWQTAVLIYGQALFFNAVHGVATVVFLLILAKPMIEKLNRVKQKYGMAVFS